ncbi:MAG: cytochrome c oxidase assembly protein [Methylophilaceae bacterium]|nr:cytochrome c oxidase assembly protein [Methylophilaceae bacterium]
MGDLEQKKANNKQLAVRLLIVAVAGLAFGFALAPLYNILCEAIGLNGKADITATAAASNTVIDQSRKVTVLFTGETMPGLDWGFSANEPNVEVYPGEIKLTSYKAINRGKQAVVGSAVPSISPEVASLYFKKIECFCFNQQTLQPGEIKDMPIRFFVSPDLPKDIKTVTLSYSFYKVDNKPR